MPSQKKSSRKQKGGNRWVGMPIQYYNPRAEVPKYYPDGSDVLTRQYMSALGRVNPVNTTQPNACGTEMGPSLAPFSPYEDVSMMTGGNSRFSSIVNPLTGRKVAVKSQLGKKILKQYLQELED
jgi:hypothetical protein